MILTYLKKDKRSWPGKIPWRAAGCQPCPNASAKFFLPNPIIYGILEAKPQPLGNFLKLFGKNNRFNAIWITFRTFLKPFKRTKLLKIGFYS